MHGICECHTHNNCMHTLKEEMDVFEFFKLAWYEAFWARNWCNMLQKSPGWRTCGHTRHIVWQCSGHQHWLMWGNTYLMCLSSLLAECCLNSANKGSLRLVIICSALLWEFGKWYYLPSTFQNAWCALTSERKQWENVFFFFSCSIMSSAGTTNLGLLCRTNSLQCSICAYMQMHILWLH